LPIGCAYSIRQIAKFLSAKSRHRWRFCIILWPRLAPLHCLVCMYSVYVCMGIWSQFYFVIYAHFKACYFLISRPFFCMLPHVANPPQWLGIILGLGSCLCEFTCVPGILYCCYVFLMNIFSTRCKLQIDFQLQINQRSFPALRPSLQLK